MIQNNARLSQQKTCRADTPVRRPHAVILSKAPHAVILSKAKDLCTLSARPQLCFRVLGGHPESPALHQRDEGSSAQYFKPPIRVPSSGGMGFSESPADERVLDVQFTDDTISVNLRDGRIITIPLVRYPRLLEPTPSQRKNWKIAGRGYGIRWPNMDEDLSTE